jgi:hypothetical protein
MFNRESSAILGRPVESRAMTAFVVACRCSAFSRRFLRSFMGRCAREPFSKSARRQRRNDQIANPTGNVPPPEE